MHKIKSFFSRNCIEILAAVLSVEIVALFSVVIYTVMTKVAN